MRRRFVSEEDRDTILRLRRSGAGWLRIQEITGIPRRTSKRVYKEWQETQVVEETTTARRQVAAEAFNSHMADLISLAHNISTGLATPQLADRRSGSQMLESIFEIDIRSRGKDKPRYLFVKKDTEDIKRQNRILFDSLKEHTKDKVDWRTLDNWLAARNDWRRGIDKFELTATELVLNILNQDADRTGLSNRIKSDKKLVSKMAGGLVETVYLNRAAGMPEEMKDYIKIKQGHGGMRVFFGGDVSETELIVESKDLADKVVDICGWVIVNLCTGKESYILQDLAGSYYQMETAHRDLVEKLDELRLTPLILRTRCEICPA